jgi:oligopeptide/dipeptide ABC transporter ATP-binding protein
MNSEHPVIKVENLKKHFPIRGGFLRRTIGLLKAVDGISFEIFAGKTFGLVGESGCGKSTLGRTVLRLHEPTSGKILLNGEDITHIDRAALGEKRREMQIIFQDPYASLSPRRTIMQTLLEPLEQHKIGSSVQRNQRVQELMETVGLRPQVMHRYPHEFSGGQRQRIGIARALALHPAFVVADEAVSALDVSVQSQVLNLLSDLQRDMGCALLFISHDLAVVQHISDIVGIMYLGQLVEVAGSRILYEDAAHPYTQALLSAVPVPDPGRKRKRIVLEGDVPSAENPPPGCPFHTRCPRAMPRCSTQKPLMQNIGDKEKQHWVSCHLWDET